MAQVKNEMHKPGSLFTEIISSLVPVITSRYFYIGLLSLIAGAALNFASQTYLHNYMSEGKTLPMLSDMILDNVPVIDVAIFYDTFCLLVIVFSLFLAHGHYSIDIFSGFFFAYAIKAFGDRYLTAFDLNT